ncbi:hypothetical protein [Nitratireductor luteus]|uniref:hypothetical protein n=1 Tax=Nitratireductor luteus TaxID=2976980 RepID=UPI00223EB9EC|nr:hypothetical protein [Nitratireductor luteus]
MSIEDNARVYLMDRFKLAADEVEGFLEISRGLLDKYVPVGRFPYRDGRIDLEGLVRESKPYFHMP